jgi:hypothetical protein
MLDVRSFQRTPHDGQSDRTRQPSTNACAGGPGGVIDWADGAGTARSRRRSSERSASAVRARRWGHGARVRVHLLEHRTVASYLAGPARHRKIPGGRCTSDRCRLRCHPSSAQAGVGLAAAVCASAPARPRLGSVEISPNRASVSGPSSARGVWLSPLPVLRARLTRACLSLAGSGRRRLRGGSNRVIL